MRASGDRTVAPDERSVVHTVRNAAPASMTLQSPLDASARALGALGVPDEITGAALQAALFQSLAA